MAILKCKMCGGDMEIAADKTFGTCEYCGSTMTLPKVDDEQRAAIFNRGNHFRRTGEFDKALAVYERIVAEDDTDAEAHWCCALCRFGIEYVEDPATYEWLPTCHRASFDSFLEDVDYLAAVEHSDGITKRQYQKDAAKIADVQRGILATSQNTEPYDVFISYKELDADGNRTRDSILAQDIYYQLTEQGRRVFFSRISLEDVPGTQYEPYIFAALNSAKVMIVVGTSADNLNAVWVKNEWSRFLSMMRKDRSKLLLPCYRDMDPYDLPEQLSVLMSYDMGKIGFIQDLIRGVNKVLDADKVKEQVKETVVIKNESASNTDALLKRGMLSVEDGDWGKAEDCFEQVLNLNPECGEAYYGKFLVENKCRSVDAYVSGRLTATKNAEKTELEALTENHDVISEAKKKYVVPGFFSEADIAGIFAFDRRYSSELRSREAQYSSETQTLENNRDICRAYQFGDGKLKKKIDEAKAVLSEKLKERVEAAKASDKSSIAGKTAAYDKKLKEAEEIAAERSTEAKRRKASKDKKSKITLYTILIVSLLTIAVAIAVNVVIPSVRYNNAVKLYDSGDFDGAIATFEKLGAYKDSTTQLNNCQMEKNYLYAISLMERGEDIEAYDLFAELGKYKESEYYTSKLYAQNESIKLKAASVGESVYFGAYEQDNNTANGNEDIEWIVLDKLDDKILLLSKYALDYQQYNNRYEETSWEKCSLRTWLGTDFLNSAFSTDEIQLILPTKTVKNIHNPNNESNMDKAFLLSVHEAEQYFQNNANRKCLHPIDKDERWWWLRSPGSSGYYYAARVLESGSIDFGGYTVYGVSGAVRPAIWIDLSK